MLHRGPDDFGEWVSADNRLALGHRRLSIIDLSQAGRQPMCNEDGSVWISFNGEIYNHLEIRKILESRGHRYKSRTDTETIIHGYEEWGMDIVEKLEGMFAFALYDTKRDRLYLVRDRLGKKPLYYTLVKNKLIFASEIKAILRHPAVSKDVNEEAFFHYLSFLFTPSPLTLFKGIYKVPTATIFTFGANGLLNEKHFWDVDAIATQVNVCDDEFYIEELRRLLREAVKKRMMADVPYGVFLSGGIDSSCNVALMSEVSSGPVNTFNVKIKHGMAKYNEEQYARYVAQYFKAKYYDLTISEEDFMNFFEKMSYYQDEPLADPVCVPTYYLSKLSRENNVTVLLAGEGSDEIFAGYPHYAHYYNKDHSFNPAFIGMSKVLNRVLEAVSLKKRLGRKFVFNGQLGFTKENKQSLISKRLSAKFEPDLSQKLIDHIYAKYRGLNGNKKYLNEVIYLEIHNRLVEIVLMRLDKMGMANSVEIRAPFLDHKLVEFSMTLPLNLKIRGKEGKYILKKAMEGVLPKDIIYREKIGFSGGTPNMLTPKILTYAQSLITQQLKGLDDYIDLETVDNFFQRYKTGAVKSDGMWALLNFALWYKTWFQ